MRPDYGKDWTAISRRMKAKFPVCLDPLALHPSVFRPSDEVHHIVPFKLTKDNSDENLIPVCRSCHEALERMINAKDSRGNPVRIYLSRAYSEHLKSDGYTECLRDELENIVRPVFPPISVQSGHIPIREYEISSAECQKLDREAYYCARRQRICGNLCPCCLLDKSKSGDCDRKIEVIQNAAKD